MSLSKSVTEQLDVRQLLSEVANQEGLGKAKAAPERRLERRTDLCIGIFVIPMNDNYPDISKAFTAIAKDVSTRVIGVIANCFPSTPEVLICLSGKSGTRVLRGLVRYRKELGLGWVRFSTEVSGMVDESEYPQLRHFVGSIMP